VTLGSASTWGETELGHLRARFEPSEYSDLRSVVGPEFYDNDDVNVEVDECTKNMKERTLSALAIFLTLGIREVLNESSSLARSTLESGERDAIRVISRTKGYMFYSALSNLVVMHTRRFINHNREVRCTGNAKRVKGSDSRTQTQATVTSDPKTIGTVRHISK
jgi:hypothetical protein